MRGKSFWSFLLALSLLLGLAVPAQAAGVRLTWEKKSAGSMELTIRGLGEESVYGLQLEMTVAGAYASASFRPADADVYTECRASASEQNTKVVVYLASQKPMNSGSILTAGTLSLDKSFSMPDSATVTLLGHELKPLDGADGSVISAAEQIRVPDDDEDEDDPDT